MYEVFSSTGLPAVAFSEPEVKTKRTSFTNSIEERKAVGAVMAVHLVLNHLVTKGELKNLLTLGSKILSLSVRLKKCRGDLSHLVA